MDSNWINNDQTINSFVELNLKKSTEDFSIVTSFCLTDDGRYLIASIAPRHEPKNDT